MKNIWGIMKKEFDKILKSPRLIFSSFIMPGLLIFFVYTFMGQSIQTEIGKTEEHVSVVHLVNTPDSFDQFVNLMKDEVKIEITKVSSYTSTDIDSLLIDSNVDAIIVYEAETMEKLPNYKIYFNQLKSFSSAASMKVQNIVSLFETTQTADLLTYEMNTVGDQQKEEGMFLAMLLPMLVVTFVFAGALSTGSDAIAGEKERGTLATLLMAPISKNQIIIGKLFSTAIITLVSSLSSFVGVIASLPFASALFNISGNVQYGFIDYLFILIILLAVALMAVCLILLASTFAKSVKEATMYAMPIYIIAILSSTISMFSQELPTELFYYFIPVYNCTLGLKGILSFSLTPVQLLIIVSSTIGYFLIISSLLVRLFKSERVLFAK